MPARRKSAAPRPNRTEYAILGLLAQGPTTGYDLKKLVEERLSHFWNESFGHLYPILARLHRRGWVRKRTRTAKGRPSRNEYSLTEAGRTALREWFWEPLLPLPPRNELLLRIFLGRSAPSGALAQSVAAYRAQRTEDLRTLEYIAKQLATDAADSPDYPQWEMTLRAGILAARAALAWCDETLPKLSNG